MAKLLIWEFICCIIFINVLLGSIQTIRAAAGHGVVYSVGDDNGWTFGHDYNAWAKGKKFHRGDILVFRFEEGYSVDEVTAEKLETCDNTDAIFSDISGEAHIPLRTTGVHYFIGGAFALCPDGMNMTITVR
ncbi:hypothetical protein Dimus_015054 [Dionaea muscipula]